jgi:hypothetical protein
VTGHDERRSANAVIMELKQWSAVDGASVVGDKVVTWVGGGHRDVLHMTPVITAAQLSALNRQFQLVSGESWEP